MKAPRVACVLLCGLFLAALSVSICFAQKYQPNSNSAREAITNGEAKEFIAAMEVQGEEAEKNGKWSLAAGAYNEATWAASNSGQLQKALSYGGKALELAEKARDQGLQVRAIYLLSQVHGNLRQYEKARELTEKGIAATKKLPSGLSKEAYEGFFYRVIGSDFVRRGQLEKATDYLSYSVQVQESRLSYYTRNRAYSPPGAIQAAVHNVVISLSPLAQAYQRAGRMEEAIKAYEKGIELIRRFSAKTQAEGSLYQGLGQVYLAQKDFPLALANLKKALALGESQQRPAAISSASLRIGDLFNQSGKPHEAIPYFERAIQQVESTRTLLQSEEYRQSYFEGELGAYVQMMQAQVSAGKAEDAFNYGERARSRTFLDILGSKVQLSRVQGGLLEEERALHERIAALKARLAAEAESAGAGGAGSRTELSQAEKAYEAFLSKVRKQDKEQASLMSVEPLTLKEVQELLEPGVSMLEYFVTEQEVLLWIVEKDKTQFVRIPTGRKALVAKVTSMRESIYQVGEKETFKISSEELYGLLIKPALFHVRGKELLIVPHDVLHYLPFQALLSPAGKYLIQDYPIYYLSSASLMQFTHAKKKTGGGTALVMGNPSLGDYAYNLRFAEREAREIAQFYPHSAVYLRVDANKSKAVSLSPKYDMLHFAVHAEFSEDDPLSSALLLAGDAQDDGRLKVGEIFSLRLNAAIVVLAACETGLGKLSNGDEMIGLTRAFIYAGTPSVVTTLWKVSDRASYELMREFYRHLKTGKKSEALRQAQLMTMKEFPEPFYWAAFGLTGEP